MKVSITLISLVVLSHYWQCCKSISGTVLWTAGLDLQDLKSRWWKKYSDPLLLIPRCEHTPLRVNVPLSKPYRNKSMLVMSNKMYFK